MAYLSAYSVLFNVISSSSFPYSFAIAPRHYLMRIAPRHYFMKEMERRSESSNDQEQQNILECSRFHHRYVYRRVFSIHIQRNQSRSSSRHRHCSPSTPKERKSVRQMLFESKFNPLKERPLSRRFFGIMRTR